MSISNQQVADMMAQNQAILTALLGKLGGAPEASAPRATPPKAEAGAPKVASTSPKATYKAAQTGTPTALDRPEMMLSHEGQGDDTVLVIRIPVGRCPVTESEKMLVSFSNPKFAEYKGIVMPNGKPLRVKCTVGAWK